MSTYHRARICILGVLSKILVMKVTLLLANKVLETTKVEDWVSPRKGQLISDEKRKRFYDEIGGYVVSPPLPNAHEALSLPSRNFFVGDMKHFSARSQEHIADYIRQQIMVALNFRNTHDPTVAPWEHTE